MAAAISLRVYEKGGSRRRFLGDHKGEGQTDTGVKMKVGIKTIKSKVPRKMKKRACSCVWVNHDD